MKSERMVSGEDGSVAGAGTAYAIMFWQVVSNGLPCFTPLGSWESISLECLHYSSPLFFDEILWNFF